MTTFFTALRPLLHQLSPETAHNAGLCALKYGLLPAAAPLDDQSLHTEILGLHFSNPVGLAAGFDKNAVAIDALLAQGFGFVEAGTVTPKAQPGNPKPRIFRLPQDEAVINRLGFNNDGLENYVRNFSRHDKRKGIAGANIGKNKDSIDAVEDYVKGIEAVYTLADYITINISSPNTKGLRDLQKRDALDLLLKTLAKTRNDCAEKHKNRVPLLLKVAPDLDIREKEDIAGLVLAHGMDGMIVSNTTISRSDTLNSICKNEQGGLSGRPLFTLSSAALSDFYRLTKATIPLIGAGGISSAQEAYAKICSGASLVQLYTALVYRGFGVVREIQRGLSEYLKRDGLTQISQAVGSANKN